MKLFACTSCSNMIYFENTTCESCDRRLGYLASSNTMIALQANGDSWLAADQSESDYRFCANAEHAACNWLVPAASPETLCAACRHNRTIPDLSIEENVIRWRRSELARHHLFYGLLKLHLPLETRAEAPDVGLAFDVLDGAVLTGHQDGVITLSLAEADDAEREQRRTQMHEPYRTLLGHFRHEIGHYYWDRLVNNEEHLQTFRDCFGDERQDYPEALENYYAAGAPSDWRDRFVSAYASSHPWEDFAETWAHFLHIVDTLEMACSFGLRVNPVVTDDAAYGAEANFDPYAAAGIDPLLRRWLPIAGAVNSINRCMGQPDLYPFVITPAVVQKLGFVQALLRPPRIS